MELILNKKEDLKKIKELEFLVNYHRKKYHEEDNPEIEDWEYDKLKRDLENLYKLYPEFKHEFKIGGRASEKFSKVKHEIKMESLHDSFSMEEIENFYNKIDLEKTEEFVIEPKIDGISLSVEYTNGILMRASTRGDGIIGEDITENALTIKNLPHKINPNIKYLEIRGECFMPKLDFKELTKFQETNGQKIFKNPRNAAAGSIRQKDAEKCKTRNLQILFFNVQKILGKNFDTHSESLEFLKSLNLPVINFKICKNFEQIKSEIENIGKIRHDFKFQTDGAVLKINSLKKRQELGSTSSFPKWAEAFKYPPEIKKTRCTDIKLSVGRTGIITPVCIFEPVNLSGSMVSKASLHNEDFIKNKDVRIGNFVYVIKSGDIIPEIIKSEPDSNIQTNFEFKMPDFCPSCGKKLTFENNNNNKILKCKNENCPEKIKSQIVHFTARDAMNIENFGEETVNILKHEIKNYSDIYKLNENILKKYKQFRSANTSNNQILMFGFNEQIYLNKIGKNLLNSIKKSKNNSLEKLIYGIGILFVGKETAKIIAKYFKNIENLQKCKIEELVQIDGIGEITAKSIFNFFHGKKNIENLNLIKKLGVNTDYLENNTKNKNQKFSGLNFAITGKFDNYSRGEIIEKIENLGGKISNSVSKNTSFVICGKNSGKKLDDAKKFNIKIINQKELENFIK